MSKSITIDFNADGSIKMEGHNFKGAECDKAMAQLEKSLGKVTDRKNKPEFHQQSATSATYAKN